MFENDEYNFNGIIGNSDISGVQKEEHGEENKPEDITERVTERAIENAAEETEKRKEAETQNVFSSNVNETDRTTDGFIQSNGRKKNKFLGTLKFVGMAAAFGLIAGGVFYGVNYTADKVLNTDVVLPSDTINETTGIVVNKTNTSVTNGVTTVMDVSQVIDNAMPSAVAITGTVTTSYQFSPFFGNGYETETPVSGSGIIIGQNDTELLMVTNAHVVEDVNGITVTFIDGSSAGAVVKGMKSNKDIAVIAVSLSDLSAETLSHISIVEIGDSDNLKMGQPVVAIGNALGEGQSSTVGWISALNRTITIDGTEYENLIMTDAAINPGNSGGALLNTEGQLIGINSAKYADEKVEGMGYAIPISSVADIINDLMNREIRNKVDEDKIGYLGISGMDISSSISQSYGWPEGIAITTIGADSPAAGAGLLKNDILVGFDGEDIRSFDQLRELMEYYEAGETVMVDYYRIENGEYVLKSVDVTLGNRNLGK